MGSSAFAIEPPDTGFTVEPPSQSQGSQKPDWLDQVGSFASGLWSKVNPKSQITGAAQLTAHPISTYVSDASQRQALMDQAEKDFKNGDYASGIARSLYGIVPFLGPQMAQAGTEIGTGQAARGLGESVGLGLQLSQPAILKGARSAYAATNLPTAADVAEAARQPTTGALKPGVKTAATGAGAALGGAVGHMFGPYGGYVGAEIGSRMGQGIANTVIPNLSPEDIMAARVARGVENAKVRQAVKAATTQPPTPTADPTSDSFDPQNGVIHVPEPNAPAPGERPGSMFSVPRETLVPAAMAGKAGALDVLQSLNQKALVIPRGAGIESPNITNLRSMLEPQGASFEAGQFGDDPNSRQVTFHHSGQPQGFLQYDIDPDGKATVNSSLIANPSFEGQGYGRQMYEKAIEDARQAGASEFSSGSSPEPGAVRVWKSLQRKYPVEKSGNGYKIDLQEEPAPALKQSSTRWEVEDVAPRG